LKTAMEDSAKASWPSANRVMAEACGRSSATTLEESNE
jgi:hypothetical protein